MDKKIKKEYFQHSHCHAGCHSGNVVYGLGFVGSAIYFIQNATGFWMGVLGILKAIVWPAFMTYGLLRFLGM